MKPTNLPCPTEEWNAYSDGELEPERNQWLANHLAHCETCQETCRLVMLENEQLKSQIQSTFPEEVPPVDLEAFYATFHSSQRSKQVEQEQEAGGRGFPWLWGQWVGAGLVMAVILVLLVPSSRDWLFGRLGERSRSSISLVPKASDGLDAHLLWMSPGQTKAKRARYKQVLLPRDLVQFVYEVPGPRYVMIAGINQQGEVFLLYHVQEKSVKVSRLQGSLPQGESFRMDNYVGLERYFLVASTKPFAWSSLKQALLRTWSKQGKSLSRFRTLAGPWQVMSFLIEKKAKRASP
ncbi:MAG: hypothetical protein EP343_00075 [Deltaproteobacteria bacterium]|nr:MAG: hypothetical protein EP343_00075 [Deltaproteobacteria bacterium]